MQSIRLAAAIGAFGLGCGSGQPSMVTRADSAGIEIVTNLGASPIVSATADTVAVFGGEADGHRAFFRVDRTLLDVDDRGRIYVLDPTRYVVNAFSPSGEFIRSWGREGDGPGELRYPLSVAVSRRGEVTVHDPGRGVFVTYSEQGPLLLERPAPYSVIFTGLRHVEVTDAGLVVWIRDDRAALDQRMDRLVAVSASGDATEMMGGVPAYRSSAYHPACSTTFSIRTPLSPSTHWSQSGRFVAVAAWPASRVDVFDGAQLVRRIHFGRPHENVSSEGAVDLLESLGARGPCNSGPAELVARHGFFPTPQTVRDVVITPDGRTWVLHGRGGPPTEITILDTQGAVEATLPPTYPMPLAFLPDGRAVIAVVDSFDVERVGIVTVDIGN